MFKDKSLQKSKDYRLQGTSNILYYIEMAQNGVKFWILSSFEQHCSIVWARLASFKNKTCIRTLFMVFWWWSFNLWRDICSKTGFITKKGPKKQSDFEYCSVLTHFAQFQGLIWPFFGNITCLRKLFGGFRDNLLILGMMFVFQHVALTRNGSKRSQILNIVQFWPVLLKSESSYGHFLEIKHV